MLTEARPWVTFLCISVMFFYNLYDENELFA